MAQVERRRLDVLLQLVEILGAGRAPGQHLGGARLAEALEGAMAHALVGRQVGLLELVDAAAMGGAADHVEVELERVEDVHDVQHDVRRAQHVAAGIEQHRPRCAARPAPGSSSASPTEAACWRAAAPPAPCGGSGWRRWRRRPRAAGPPPSAFILAMVTHWRTLMSSGQASLQRALPSQAPSHFCRPSAAAPPPRVSAAKLADALARPGRRRGRSRAPSGRPRNTCRRPCSGRPLRPPAPPTVPHRRSRQSSRRFACAVDRRGIKLLSSLRLRPKHRPAGKRLG